VDGFAATDVSTLVAAVTVTLAAAKVAEVSVVEANKSALTFDEFAGTATKVAVNVAVVAAVSPAAIAAVKGTTTSVPTVGMAGVTVPRVSVYSATAAFAGTTDNRPKPNADTATSAMRLIDVFVDICFLSKKVEIEDFSRSAGRLRTHSSDMSEPFLSWG
jgi:hypothetical protein